ncbi:STM4015 family protein [Actinoplanes rectilineatus]|uniref:STM4015 family protein n=1 Tax=Actinoplanes rectilineatus TaxID=113571 RepID=UPI000698456B|nr:STM4015 family protein [Actinoplanes rectilineatus]
MTINEHLTTFAGLPVVSWDTVPDDPSSVAWRIDTMGEDEDHFAKALAAVIERTGPDGPAAIVIGDWDGAFDDGFDAELLTDHADQLRGLRALFVGEMTFEQCEISWINQGDMTPILEAFPGLEHLWIRGSQGLEFPTMRHEGLRHLVLQSGGLPASVVRSISACDLPNLAHLELWLGVDNYGGDVRADDLSVILAGRALPSLISLALRNAEIADEVAEAVASAPVVARVTELDLSMGALGDDGAAALLAGQPLTHLSRLDLHHHFMSEDMTKRLVDELKGVLVDVSDPQQEEEWGRYTEVSE